MSLSKLPRPAKYGKELHEEQHKITQTGQVKKQYPFSCYECALVFNVWANLERHCIMVHRFLPHGIKYTCERCNRSTLIRYSMIIHYEVELLLWNAPAMANKGMAKASKFQIPISTVITPDLFQV